MNKISAIIVTFNPELERFKFVINSVSTQVNNLIIVDNGSSNIGDLKVMFNTDDFNGEIIENGKNLGIAEALNIGIEHAKQEGTEWVLTLDDDSICSNNFVQSALEIIDENPNQFAQISTNVQYSSARKNESNDTFTRIKLCITSGSILNVNAWEAVGKFNKELFIDYVDFDFCYRLDKAGYVTIRNNKSFIDHQLGEETKVNMFPFISRYKVVTYNYSPIRTYYYTRNRLYCIRKYCGFSQSIKQLLSLVRFNTKKLLYEKNKGKNIRAIMRGTIDSFKLK
ncbi:glycosyltransferase family 2 protein [Erysipelothrix sp. HDW6C]|uniref:glycosyltransferase family 2 protein n=1 Tax=Erysipelothrix sp. HDW6C TaxID=2714930 RepID=UPI00140E545B|nr:glycosyltransferase family 2 protein [Erysipelothrix sp. HDW6C]QIK70007.1 glycosyltransferase family 2 protein [Erysipelothrix sp. HDW6C]